MVYQSTWMSGAVAKGGVINAPKKTDTVVGGTLVAIVDLDRSAEVIRFANSWGVDWGDRGSGP